MKNRTPCLLTMIDKLSNSSNSLIKSREGLSKFISYKIVDKIPQYFLQPPNYIQLSPCSTISSLTKAKQYKKR